MNIFEQILIIFFILLAVLLVRWRLRHRLKFLQKITKLNILKHQQNLMCEYIFISYVIDICVQKLYWQRTKKTKNALAYMAAGRLTKAIKILAVQDKLLSVLLLAHNDTHKAYKQISHISQKALIKHQYFVFCIMLAQVIGHSRQAEKWLKQINEKQLQIKIKAYYKCVLARYCMYKGDMASASENAYSAMRSFYKRRYFMEVASCYMLLADIYRLSCMCDTAQAMLAAAQKIYQQFPLPQQQALVVASKGLLLFFDNRLNEAEDCYIKALKIAPNLKTEAEILNQYALLEINLQKYAEAEKKIKQALSFYRTYNIMAGEAFSSQLLGQIYFELENYEKAIKHLNSAANNYYILENFSAFAESLYLCADIYFRQQKNDAAERLLQEILQTVTKQHSNFHLGHVYGLLGVLNMEKGEFLTALEWLKKSLWLEQNTKRYEGAAVDCLNLSLAEQSMNNTAEAKQYAAEALEYALKTEDEDFIALIKEKMLY